MNPAVERWFHQPSIRSSTSDHDSCFELPACAGRQGAQSETRSQVRDQGATERPCMGAICAHEAVARSSQYNFTASLRAMATLATLAPLLNFNRRYTRCSSGSNRTAVCAAPPALAWLYPPSRSADSAGDNHILTIIIPRLLSSEPWSC